MQVCILQGSLSAGSQEPPVPAATFWANSRLVKIGLFHHKKGGRVTVQIVRRTTLLALASVELVVLLAALTKPAYGYVDPGSGGWIDVGRRFVYPAFQDPESFPHHFEWRETRG